MKPKKILILMVKTGGGYYVEVKIIGLPLRKDFSVNSLPKIKLKKNLGLAIKLSKAAKSYSMENSSKIAARTILKFMSKTN